MADVSLDVAELRRLLAAAARPRVRELLEREIAALSKSEENKDVELRDGEEAHAAAEGTAAGAAAAGVSAGAGAHPPVVLSCAPVLLQTGKAPAPVSYSSLTSFSWDQDSDKVKIYFFLEGAAKEKTELEVKPQSVELRLHDVEGKNLRFRVPRLCKEVEPSACSVLVKPSRVTVTLRKRERGHWMDLQYKEDKLAPKVDSGKDPMAGIMDLMKNMYDDGDEDMKRTIAKAWSEAQSGKKADPTSSMAF